MGLFMKRIHKLLTSESLSSTIICDPYVCRYLNLRFDIFNMHMRNPIVLLGWRQNHLPQDVPNHLLEFDFFLYM
jgi:hypothetical protein